MKLFSALLIAFVSCALYFAGVDSYFSSSASLLGVPGKRLEGRVCVVTGGARGIGKGIALGLGDEGATVYVTGRTEKDVLQTAKEVTSRGGQGIAVVVDHSKVEEIKGLFDKIRKEQSELHLLVNNCYSAAGKLFEQQDKKFFQKDLGWWDEVNNVGLKAHFIASQLAVPMMLNSSSSDRPPLIVHVSSAGGLRYIFDVAYGVGKAAVDRMAQDMAVELAGTGVAVVSLWPGAVSTELIRSKILDNPSAGADSKRVFSVAESPLLQGRAVAALAADASAGRFAGRTLFTSDLAHRYGLVDVDGQPPAGLLSLSRLLREASPALAALVPRSLRIPNFILNQISGKF